MCLGVFWKQMGDFFLRLSRAGKYDMNLPLGLFSGCIYGCEGKVQRLSLKLILKSICGSQPGFTPMICTSSNTSKRNSMETYLQEWSCRSQGHEPTIAEAINNNNNNNIDNEFNVCFVFR